MLENLPSGLESRRFGYDTSMRFAEKLAKLTENGGKAKLSQKAGLPSTAISDYISKGNVLPRVDKALSLARALAVPLEWLADDAQGWPPPEPTSPPSASDLSDRKLMGEVVRRRRLVRMNALESLEIAEGTDWASVRRAIPSVPKGGPLTPDLAVAILLAFTLGHSDALALLLYDSNYYETLLKNKHPELGVPTSQADYESLNQRWQRIRSNPEFIAVILEVKKRQDLLSKLPPLEANSYGLAMAADKDDVNAFELPIIFAKKVRDQTHQRGQPDKKKR